MSTTEAERETTTHCSSDATADSDVKVEEHLFHFTIRKHYRDMKNIFKSE